MTSPQNRRRTALLFILLLLAGLSLAACDGLPRPEAAESLINGTFTPTPTRDPSGYQAVAATACEIDSWPVMQSDQPAGSLIAWQPVEGGGLAYLAPDNRSSWYTGRLMFAHGDGLSEQMEFASTVLVTGDLTWSPSGDRLAFLAYRPDEGLVTVMAIQADGSGLVDLMPADLARTDSRSSQKAIIGWKNNQTVQVLSSCGEECRSAYDLPAAGSPGPVLTPTPVSEYQQLTANLQISRSELDFEEGQYPKTMRSPHWSPDKQQIAYLDTRGLLWLLSIDAKTQQLIDIGLRSVYETQWSADSRRLAIRAEDRIFVYNVDCTDSD